MRSRENVGDSGFRGDLEFRPGSATEKQTRLRAAGTSARLFFGFSFLAEQVGLDGPRSTPLRSILLSTYISLLKKCFLQW